jgi:hypothetical protein
MDRKRSACDELIVLLTPHRTAMRRRPSNSEGSQPGEKAPSDLRQVSIGNTLSFREGLVLICLKIHASHAIFQIVKKMRMKMAPPLPSLFGKRNLSVNSVTTYLAKR